MTQAMPPALPVAGSPAPAATAAKSEPNGEFSETFRDQLDIGVPDAPVDDVTQVSAGVTAAGEAVAAQQPNLPAAALPDGLSDNQMIEPAVSMSLALEADTLAEVPVAAVPMTNAAQITDVARATSSPGSARAKPVTPVSPTLAAPSHGSAEPGTDVGEPATPPMANLKAGELAQDVTQNNAARSELFAQHLSRSNEAPAPLTSTAAPVTVMGLSHTTGQNPLATNAAVTALPGVDTPLADPDWPTAIGARVLWGATQKIQTATIAINPRELGPVNVNLTLADDEASVSFVSQHAVVREAIEAAMPRLREMFSSDGITLGDVDISAGDEHSGGGHEATSHKDANSQPDGDATPASASNEGTVRLVDSLVDTFA